MASAWRLGRFRGRKQRAALQRLSARTITVQSPRAALAASAARLDVSDRQEAKVQRMLRQGWQSDAWNYRDTTGELRYAVNFLANCAARMRLYPAIYPLGGEADEPVALDKATGIPANVQEQLVSTSGQAMQALGNGRMAISGLLHGASTNKSVAGEGYLLGRTDQQTAEQVWSVRSVDELVVADEKWHLREIPDNRQDGVIPWIELDPALTVISRMWTPHPRFQLLADAPVRAMLDDLESLGILRRMIRATGRSRLASRGLLLMPNGISIPVPVDDDADPEADPFMAGLAEAMMAPIVSEGTADGVVPIVIRGPGEELERVRLLDMASQFDEQASKTRSELVGIIATTFDLPKEIIVGVADLNHWSAWQVDDNTFRHHVEPHVIAVCDDLSGAYLRPYLQAKGIPEFWAQRMVFWYDPTELVTHPDRAADAEKAYAAMTISAKAYREATGWTEEDAPSVEELEQRRVMDIRALPLNLLMEYARRADPTLVVPPMTGPPELPGIKPGGVDVAPGADAPAPPAGSPTADATPARPVAPSSTPGPPPVAAPPKPAPPSVTAAGGEPNTGAMIALYPTPQLAEQLALPDGEPAEELHITLAFLGQASDLADPEALQSAVKEWAASWAPLTGEISGVGLFTAGEDPVTYVSPDLPALPAARQQLIDALGDAGADHSQEHGYTPHITLDYADRVGEVPSELGGTALRFETVSVVLGEDRTDYPLSGTLTAAAIAAAPDTADGPHARLSRRLATIDATLRARLQTAANAAMLRQLERAGAKTRTKLARDETSRVKIAHRANDRVTALLGRDVVTAAGLSPTDLIDSDWSGLRAQFYEWTEAAQAQALKTALRIGHLAEDSAAATQAAEAMGAGRDAAWQLLSDAMTHLGEHLLYNPDPNVGPGDWADLSPDTLVPAGTIRAALGVAGGADSSTALLDPSSGAVALGSPVGQIGTGSTIGDLLTNAGATQESYTWIHGPSLKPFEPHEDLDGVVFDSFDDAALANTSGWPDNAYYMPGDHDGCLCDFMPNWMGPQDTGDDDS